MQWSLFLESMPGRSHYLLQINGLSTQEKTEEEVKHPPDGLVPEDLLAEDWGVKTFIIDVGLWAYALCRLQARCTGGASDEDPLLSERGS